MILVIKIFVLQLLIINIGDIKLWAQRLSYVGIGYEIYVNVSDAINIYEKIIDTGKILIFLIVNAFTDTMRMESGFYIGVMIFPQRKSVSSWS